MTYRFRHIIERPDWNPPQAITLEIAYEAKPQEVDYDEGSCSGGVCRVSWVIVAVRGPMGQYHQPEAFWKAMAAIAHEPGILIEIRDLCEQDFAQQII